MVDGKIESREYRRKNPAIGKKATKKYYDRNKKKILKIHREWRKKNPLIGRAYAKVCHALKTGILTKLPCEICKNKELQAHHDDYSKPLNVIWLCRYHHGERHQR